MKTVLILSALLLTGCASSSSRDYSAYLEAQKSISRDITANEIAKIQSLIELTKNADPTVRATAIMMLQQLQTSSQVPKIEPPKK